MRVLAAIVLAGCSSSTPPATTTPVGAGSSAPPAAASACIAGIGGVRLGEITATTLQFCFDTYGDSETPTTTCYARDLRSGVVTSTPVLALPKPAEDDGAAPGDVLAVDDKRGLAIHRDGDGLGVQIKTKAGKVTAKFEPAVEPTLARFVPAGILFTFQAAGPGSDAAFHTLDGKLIDRVGGPVKEGDENAVYMNLYTAGQNPIDLADGRYVFLDAGGDFIALHAASGKFERRIAIVPPDSKTRELSEEEMMDADIGGHDSMTLLPDGKLAVVRGFPRYGSISLVDLASGTSTHLPAPERCVKPAPATN